VPENVSDKPLGGHLVPDIKGWGVCEGERDGLMLANFGKV